MQRIQIKPDLIIQSSKLIPFASISIIQKTLSITRNNLDYRIKNRNNIHQRLQNTIQELIGIERKLRELEKFTLQSMERYTEVENSLVERLAMLDEMRNHHIHFLPTSSLGQDNLRNSQSSPALKPWERHGEPGSISCPSHIKNESKDFSKKLSGSTLSVEEEQALVDYLKALEKGEVPLKNTQPIGADDYVYEGYVGGHNIFGKPLGGKAPTNGHHISTMLDFVPIIGNVKSIGEAYYGHDPLAGRELEDWERWVAVAGVLFGGIGKFVGKGVPKLAEGLGDISNGADYVKHLDSIPRIKEIEVNFKGNIKHDSEEFARQLKAQEKGMNELTVNEYLKNREKYIAQGRAIEGNAAQQAAREEAYVQKINELQREGLTLSKAKKQAKEWLETQAALHNPDQIAGGKAELIGGLGDKGINSSIGSQWRYRIDIVDEQIKELSKNMTPDQLQITYLNVKLTH